MSNPRDLIQIIDCTPAMADVASGAIPRPRERKSRETGASWLRQSPVMPALEKIFPEFQRRWPTIAYRPDIKPPASLGLADFPNRFLLIWEAPPHAHTRLLCVNTDGTRCALVDPVALLIDTWARLGRSSGRPRHAEPKPATLAQRKWRERQK